MSKLRPLLQGDCDGLCGVYAVINAIRFLCPEMKTRDADALFERLMRSIRKSGADPSKVMVSGMDLCLLKHITRSAIKYMRKAHGVSLNLSWPSSAHRKCLASLIEYLKEHSAIGSVVIIALKITRAHWTVVTSSTEKRLRLLDSADRRHIGVNRCTLKRRREPSQIRLYRNHVVALRRTPNNGQFGSKR